MIPQSKAAADFAKKWAGVGDEKQDSQRFWIELLQKVYGVEDPASFVRFEQRVQLSHVSYIDVMIPATHTMIEQKSLGKDLNAPIKQSDGTLLKPFEQAKRYAAALPYSERPRWIVSCNFQAFQVYDMERPNDEPERIELKDLGKEYYRLQFMVDVRGTHIQRELDLSREAGTLVGKIYSALLPCYGEQPTAKDFQDLNKLIVRLVFCFYAEDAGLFGRKNQFHDYLDSFRPQHFRTALVELFRVLDQKSEDRDKFLEPELASFPYVNGSLFTESVPIPPIDAATRELILTEGCGFDWSGISPTIFGAIFEGTLNPETRRHGGMHYTSIENIHKVIDPLFLDHYKQIFQAAMDEKNAKTRSQKLRDLQKELGRGKYFDPACGSGNFLTESYLSLRRLENDILRETVMAKSGTGVLGFDFDGADDGAFIQVTIGQFYGIEIQDFACAVAKTALWIAESQMARETEEILHREMSFLPLTTNTNLHEANALRVDWREILPPSDDVKIMGNPPFVGARMMDATQKNDVQTVFDGWKNIGDLDYVSCWYKKAAEYMRGTNIHAAFVSTNSITQGVQVAILWKPLFTAGIHFDFAYRTFRWDSEAVEKAHVHCVIIGFSADEKIPQLTSEVAPKNPRPTPPPLGEVAPKNPRPTPPPLGEVAPKGSERVAPSVDSLSSRQNRESRNAATLSASHSLGTSPRGGGVDTKFIDSGGVRTPAKNINAYLMDAPIVFIESRNKPLCDVPEIGIGNQPIDNGNYLFTEEEMKAFLKTEPGAEKYFHPWYGSQEFINRRPRYCLWLGEASPKELLRLPHCLERVENVRQFRLASKRKSTQKLADQPTHFQTENMPKGDYIVLPEVSSQNRRYIPMGYMDDTVMCSNLVKLMPNATLFHFGILESNVHMAWMRAVAGRLKSDYRYSKDIVYNNFPWPTPTDAQRKEIERTAQEILVARKNHPDSSFADMYGEHMYLYPDLLEAHRANDRAVLRAYGLPVTISESDCVAALMRRYEALAGK